MTNFAAHLRPVVLALLAAAVLTSVAANAQETVPGDTCGTAGLFRQSTGTSPTDGGHFLFCDGTKWVGFLQYSSSGDLYFSSVGAVALPDGTTAQRPVAAFEGMIRYNTTLNTFEGYVDDGTPAWEDLLGGGSASAAAPDRGIQFNSGGAFAADSTLVYTSTGDLGIGTSAPATKLDVEGYVNLGSDTNAAYGYQFVGRDDEGLFKAANFLDLYLSSLGGVRINIDSNSNETDRVFSVATNVNAYTGGTEVFRVQEDGNVAIGTTTPGAKLHSNTTSTAGNTVLEALRLSHEDSNSGGAANIGAAMTFNLETATNATFAEAARIESVFTDATAASKDADLRFYTMGPDASGSTTTERVRITSAGDVGIGITNPANKLDVAGTVQADGLQLDSVAGDPPVTMELDQLGDVDTTGVGDGDCLVYDNGTSTWEDGSCGAAGASAIDGLSDAIYSLANDNMSLGTELAFFAGATGNLFIGESAGTAGTSNAADNNIAIGLQALDALSTGQENLAIGKEALTDLTQGGANIALGYRTANSVTTGSYNIALGFQALFGSNGDSNSNIAIGYQAGDNITTGDDNIIIGNNIDAPSATGDYQLNIGNAIYGNLSTGRIGVGTTSPGALLHSNTTSTTGNTVLETLRLSHERTGGSGGQAGIGAALTFNIETATNNTFAEAAQIYGTWDDPTAASKDGALVFATMGPNAAGATTTNHMALTSDVLYLFGDNYDFAHESYGSFAPDFRMRRARGIVDSPTAVQNGDNLAAIIFSGYANGAFQEPAMIEADVIGTVSGSNVPTDIVISTGNGATTAERMRIESDGDIIFASNGGNVAIGPITPSVELDVSGDIEYTGTIADVSDARLKTDIANLSAGQLEKIIALQGVSFRMKAGDGVNHSVPGPVELGLIAQDVQPIFPDLVHADDAGMLSLNYVGLIAPMIEAMKEQQAQIERQNALIDDLIARLEALEAAQQQ